MPKLCQKQGHTQYTLEFLCLNPNCKTSGNQDSIEILQLKIQALLKHSQFFQSYNGYQYGKGFTNQIKNMIEQLNKLKKYDAKSKKNKTIQAKSSRLACVKCVIENHQQHKNMLVYLPDILQNEQEIEIFNKQNEQNLQDMEQKVVNLIKTVNQKKKNMDQDYDQQFLQGLTNLQKTLLGKVINLKELQQQQHQQAFVDQKEYIASVQNSVKIYPQLDEELYNIITQFMKNKVKKQDMEDTIRDNLDNRKAYKNKLTKFLEKKKSFIQINKDNSKQLKKQLKFQIQDIIKQSSDYLNFVYIDNIVQPQSKFYNSHNNKFNFNMQKKHIISTQGLDMEDGIINLSIRFSDLIVDEKVNAKQNEEHMGGGLFGFQGAGNNLNQGSGMYDETDEQMSIYLILKSQFDSNQIQQYIVYQICKGTSEFNYLQFRQKASTSVQLNLNLNFNHSQYSAFDDTQQMNIEGYEVQRLPALQSQFGFGGGRGGLFGANNFINKNQTKIKAGLFIELIVSNCINLDVEFTTPLRNSTQINSDFTQFFKPSKKFDEDIQIFIQQANQQGGQGLFGGPRQFQQPKQQIGVMVQTELALYSLHYQMKVSQLIDNIINKSIDKQDFDIKKLYPNPQLALFKDNKLVLLKKSAKIEEYRPLIEGNNNGGGGVFGAYTQNIIVSNLRLVNVDII